MHFYKCLIFSLSSFDLGLDLLLYFTIFYCRLLWSISALCMFIFSVWILLPKDLIVWNCWKSYVYSFLCYILSLFVSLFLPIFCIPLFSFYFYCFSQFCEKVLPLILILDFILILKLLKLALFLDLQLFFSFSFFCCFVLFCYSNALLSGEYVNLNSSIVLL